MGGQKLIKGLIRRGVLQDTQLPRIEMEVRRRRVRLQQVLLDLGFVTERDLLELRSEHRNLPRELREDTDREIA